MNILLIHNSHRYAVNPGVTRFLDWVRRHTPLQPTIDSIDLDVPLTYKAFGVVINGQERWGLDGIKEQLRQTGRIPQGKYHIVIFLYDFGPSQLPIGAWTYPNDLNGTVFIEIPLTQAWVGDWLYAALTHEFLHACHRLCWAKNVITKDTMDLYDKETDVDSSDGNRARNLTELSPHWPVIGGPTRASLIESIQLGIQRAYALLAKLTLMSKPSALPQVAQAIKAYEGWKPGSRSYRNNNPGNLRFARQKGTTGKDDKNFAIFDSYESGWTALIRQLTIVANGTSGAYSRAAQERFKLKDSSQMTLIHFFTVYAPSSDDNDPVAYALFVCKKTGLDPKTLMRDIL